MTTSSEPTSSMLESTTKQRLLDAAGQVFADAGFRDATIREICKAAGVNIAAVNYHFGDKEGLYRAVLQSAASEALSKYPIQGGVSADASPRDQLIGFIRNYMGRIMGEGRPAWHGKLISREMVEPTPVLDDLAKTFVRPQFERLCGILTAYLGPAATPERVKLCATSVVGQCIFHKNCRPILERLMPDLQYDASMRATLTAHITDFTLRALDDLKRASEGNASTNGGLG